MPDYKKMYHTLFNAVTEVLRQLEQAQIDTEEIYISDMEEDDG